MMLKVSLLFHSNATGVLYWIYVIVDSCFLLDQILTEKYIRPSATQIIQGDQNTQFLGISHAIQATELSCDRPIDRA